MGLIGLISTLVIMGLGLSYYFFGMAPKSMTITNDTPPAVQGLGLYENLKTQANDIKKNEEDRVKEEMAILDDTSQKSGFPMPATQETDAANAVNEALSIIDRLMSSGFSVPAKTRTIDTIVLHSSYNPNGGDAYGVAELVQIYESYGVSAHYLIDRSGGIYQLVEDKNIAYHAGASKMPDGRKDVNNFSIGIEMINKEDTQFTKAQYEAVNMLIAMLKKKYGIKYIVGHSDIAPARKTDPWNFDWKKLK